MKHHLHTAHALCGTPLGDLLLAATPQGLCGAWFTEGQKDSPAWAEWEAPEPGHSALAGAMRQLDAYFAGRRVHFDVPLDLSSGTPFQQTVWRALLAIEANWSISRRAASCSAIR